MRIVKIKNCVHCQTPNKGGWFYCRDCGKKASKIRYTTNLWMTSDIGKRTDVELTSQSMDHNMSEMKRRIGYA